MSRWTAPQMWAGGRCFILGGGPSLLDEFEMPEAERQAFKTKAKPPAALSSYLESIHREHVIGVNNAYMIGDWIDVLFFGDCSWYNVHREPLSKWPKIKVTCCNRFDSKDRAESEGIKYLAKDPQRKKGISTDPTRVSWNSNSGAAAISLAAHFGVREIILLGFDMKASEQSQDTHWFGGHGHKRRQPPFDRHIRGFPIIAKEAQKRRIKIWNASSDTRIDSFPQIALKDIL